MNKPKLSHALIIYGILVAMIVLSAAIQATPYMWQTNSYGNDIHQTLNVKLLLKPGPDGLIPNKNPLIGRRRPNLAVPEIPVYGENVLKAVVPGLVSGRQTSDTKAAFTSSVSR